MKFMIKNIPVLIILLFLNACSSGQKDGVSQKKITLNLGDPEVIERENMTPFKILFDRQGRLYAKDTDLIWIWDIKKREVLKKIKIRSSGFAVSPDGKLLGLGQREKAVAYDVEKGKITRVFPGHWDWVEGCAIHPSGKYLVTSDDKSNLRFWDIKTGKKITTIKVPNILNSYQFSLNGSLLIGGTGSFVKDYIVIIDFNKKAVKYSIANGTRNSTISIYENKNDLLAAIITTVYNKYNRPHRIYEIQVWDIHKRTNVQKIRIFDKSRDSEFIRKVAFHPSGKLIVSGTDNGSIWIIRVDNKQILYSFNAEDFFQSKSISLSSVKFSPDGKMLVAGFYNKLLIWEIPENIDSLL